MRKPRNRHQELPPTGAEREALREVGQFWTPPWVANAMVAYVMGGGADEVFDPAVGAGAFVLAAREWANRKGRVLAIRGTEIDPASLGEARAAGVTDKDLSGIEIRDFVLDPPNRHFQAIVANPPYVRHHRLPASTKETLQRWAKTRTGRKIDGRAGLHIYFLLRALDHLSPSGRLAYILPADTFEGVFAPRLWSWVAQHYCVDAVVTFEHEATPFPGVDTNAVVVFVRNVPPRPHLIWARCSRPDDDTFERWVGQRMPTGEHDGIIAHDRSVAEAVTTGLSRRQHHETEETVPLGALVSTMRGIATGDNDFFLMTRSGLEERELPLVHFVRVVGRTRDVPCDTVSAELLDELEAQGRPTHLLSLGNVRVEQLGTSMRAYLEEGVRRGLPDRALIKTRRPWYRMETRTPPPFLFAYLGRRNSRFIRNRAGALPLTGFLCVYPAPEVEDRLDDLWALLSSDVLLTRLALVAKSYGSGALKVEPRALERLPVPLSVLSERLREVISPELQLPLLVG
jgi:hypothetical protein